MADFDAQLREQLTALIAERDELLDYLKRHPKERVADIIRERDEYRAALEEARQEFLANGEQILKDFYSEYNNRLGMSIDFKECYAARIKSVLAKYPREEKP